MSLRMMNSDGTNSIVSGGAYTQNEILDIVMTGLSGYWPITDLGTSYTPELKEDISSGTFKKARVGGRLTINGHKYLFAHPDYWLNTGDTKCTDHHMVVVPEEHLGIVGKMNSANSTNSGYINSELYNGYNDNTALARVKAIIEADFGASNILTHRETFSTQYKHVGLWFDSRIDLMNEAMVYGGFIFSSIQDGTAGLGFCTIDKSQLLLFQLRPDLINIRVYWWLRDVVSDTYFACVDKVGTASYFQPSLSAALRPAFAVC